MNTNWYSSPTSTIPLASGVSYTSVLSTGNLPSTYSFYASSGTCTNSAARTLVTVTVNPVPLLTLANSSTFVCNGQPAAINVSGSGNFSISANGSSASPFVPPAIVSPSVGTAYSVQTSNMYGCRTGSISMVYVGYGPQLSLNSSPPTVCAGKNATLFVSGGSTYSWSAPGQPWFAVGPNALVNPLISTSYTVAATGLNGCISSSVISVPVSPDPTVMVTTNNSLVCAGQSVTLTAFGANVYIWNPQPLQYLNPFTAVISPSVTSSYTVTGISYQGCSAAAIYSQAVDRCTGLENNGSAEGFQIYPNPNHGKFSLRFPFPGSPGEIGIFDISGKLLQQLHVSAANEEIFLQEELSNGVYLVICSSEGRRAVRKMVVAH